MAKKELPKPKDPKKKEHYTDLGNTERMIRRYGDRLRYCATQRMWYVWDGKRWEPDSTGQVMWAAKATVRAMYREAADRFNEVLKKLEELAEQEGGADREAVKEAEEKAEDALYWAKRDLDWAIESQAKYRLEAMVHVAETEPPVPITVEMLDADPWLLNVQNGTLDLRTGKLRNHSRDDLITRITPTEWYVDAQDERWDLFVEQTMPDEGVRSYVQKALGYSLTGSGAEGGMFLPYGDTHTGKTTLLESCKAALGSYAVTMDVETLTSHQRNRDGGRPRFDLVRLMGARLVVSTEVPAGVRLDEALVKKLTGGDTFVARGLYARTGDEAQASFVIWLGSNHRPSVRDDDDAVWQRVRQIPFREQHLGEARDKTLKPYLESEARVAVLAWLVQGAAMYQADGLETPEAVTSLTEEYRREMNPLWMWAEECCDRGPKFKSTYHLLRASYEEFTRRGDRPVGTRKFENALKTLPGVTYERKARMYTGIAISVPEPDEEVRQSPADGKAQVGVLAPY
jgi:putative DNA primase/helicase